MQPLVDGVVGYLMISDVCAWMSNNELILLSLFEENPLFFVVFFSFRLDLTMQVDADETALSNDFKQFCTVDDRRHLIRSLPFPLNDATFLGSHGAVLAGSWVVRLAFPEASWMPADLDLFVCEHQWSTSMRGILMKSAQSEKNYNGKCPQGWHETFHCCASRDKFVSSPDYCFMFTGSRREIFHHGQDQMKMDVVIFEDSSLVSSLESQKARVIQRIQQSFDIHECALAFDGTDLIYPPKWEQLGRHGAFSFNIVATAESLRGLCVYFASPPHKTTREKHQAVRHMLRRMHKYQSRGFQFINKAEFLECLVIFAISD
jgi:hypothetical protein